MKVLSLEQMNKLKELGVDTNKASVRIGYNYSEENEHELPIAIFEHEDNNYYYFCEKYEAFTLQDIIELLPTNIHVDGGFFYLTIMRTYIFYYFLYEDDKRILNKEFDDDIMQSAYEMLIWVAENGYLKIKQNGNKRKNIG